MNGQFAMERRDLLSHMLFLVGAASTVTLTEPAFATYMALSARAAHHAVEFLKEGKL